MSQVYDAFVLLISVLIPSRATIVMNLIKIILVVIVKLVLHEIHENV